MSRQPVIPSVTDNADKQITYRKQMQRFSKAINQEFYLEAMVISYAALEDRLRSFLYHMGAIRNFNDSSPNVGKTRKQLRSYYFGSAEEASGKQIKLDNISAKSTLIRTTVEHISELDSTNDFYEKALKSVFSTMDLPQLMSTLDEIMLWCKNRNELIHGLLNKNIGAVDEVLEEKALQGMNYVRIIDQYVRKLKRKNNVRGVMRIPS